MSENYCTEECWKDVVGYEGFYQVSDQGRIKSLARTVPMSDGRMYRVSAKILKPIWNGLYFQIVFCSSGKEEVRLVHRLVLMNFIGPCPEGMECRHLDGNPKNNCLSNLCWGTHLENWEDRRKHGTSHLGVRGKNKLQGKTKEIYELRKTGLKIKEIASKYNVSMAAIYVHLKKLGKPSA